MAIYKNREVAVTSITPSTTNTKLVTIMYPTGETENVALGAVRLTKDEKKSLQKQYPNDFDDVAEASDEDLKSIRLGVAPSYDSDRKAQAEAQATKDAAEEQNRKLVEAQKKEADKTVDAKVNK